MTTSALIVASLVVPQAVATKFVDKLGVVGLDFKVDSLLRSILAPADNAGKSDITSLITALIALVLLAAIVYFLLGLIRVLRGTRGGAEMVGQVVVALVMGIAVFQVLA